MNDNEEYSWSVTEEDPLSITLLKNGKPFDEPIKVFLAGGEWGFSVPEYTISDGTNFSDPIDAVKCVEKHLGIKTKNLDKMISMIKSIIEYNAKTTIIKTFQDISYKLCDVEPSIFALENLWKDDEVSSTYLSDLVFPFCRKMLNIFDRGQYMIKRLDMKHNRSNNI